MSSDEDKNFIGIQLLEYDEDGDLTRKVEALSGNYNKKYGWNFSSATVTSLSKEKQVNKIQRFESYPRTDLEEDPIIMSNISELQVTPSISQINSELNSGRPIDDRRKSFLVTRKYSLYFAPMSCLIGILLGIPLATSSQRQAGMASASKAIGIMIIFYIINSIFTNLGKNDILPPALAASLGSLIFLCWGILASIKD